MLIINILLIVLFIFILFYNKKIIEGQGTGSDENPEGEEQENDESYSILNLFPELFHNEVVIFEKKTHDDLRDKVNLFGLFNNLFNDEGLYENERDINHEYLTCKDDENVLTDLPVDVTIHNQNINNNQRSTINDLLNNFDIKLDLGPNIQQDETNINENQIPLCDLVEELYINSDISKHNNILNGQFRDCFFISAENEFINNCEKSCYDNTIKENNIIPCLEYEIEGTLECPDITDLNENNSLLLQTIITNNDNKLHYNCMSESNIENIRNSSNNRDIDIDINNLELNGVLTKNICNPSGLICANNLVDSCGSVNETQDLIIRKDNCESSNYTSGDKKYNCIFNETNNMCQDSIEIDNKILKKRCYNRDEFNNYEQCGIEEQRNENGIKINEGETEYIVTLF